MPSGNQAGPPRPPTRKLTIIAQDPGVLSGGRILRARVTVPAEELDPGPRGYRVQVIDYDASTGRLYRPLRRGLNGDPFQEADDEQLLSSPHFHAFNTYAIVMRTLARFEHALGRRVSWSFSGHQIQVAPHAFADANAFYSERDRALMFGYFPGRQGTVFSCLSHDVVAHETTHALLDGLRTRYKDASSPDQAAFHEGFADIVALLSVFSLPGVVTELLARGRRSRRIPRSDLDPKRLRRSILFGLAEQMGDELSLVRGSALRRSAELEPSPAHLADPQFLEPHLRGEILVAAMMNAFLAVWLRRTEPIGDALLDRERVAEEGANAAEHLLTMSIRAIDYAPPTDLEFSDFLSALLTADTQIQPDDSRYGYRNVLLKTFADYGIHPASKVEGGAWEPPEGRLNYGRTHFEQMQRDPDEVFRFVWENRKRLRLYEDAYSRVLSVRPCTRVSPDGFLLRETVAEYVQILKLSASELKRLKVRKPADMPASTQVTLYGGGSLVFDQYGRLKFHVRNRVDQSEKQSARLSYLWEQGQFAVGASRVRRISRLHRQRTTQLPALLPEEY